MSHPPSSSTSSSTSEASQSSAHSPHSDMARSHSLKSTTTSLRVPPSLRESPLLNSPYSIFKRAMPSEALSDADERWLQDTIPVSTTSTWENSPSHIGADVSAIPSTPLARSHQNVHQPSIKPQEKNVMARSESNIPRPKEQGYFDLILSSTS